MCMCACVHVFLQGPDKGTLYVTSANTLWALNVLNGSLQFDFSFQHRCAGGTTRPVMNSKKTLLLVGSSTGELRGFSSKASYSVYKCQNGACSGTWGAGESLGVCEMACAAKPALYKCTPNVNGVGQQCLGDPKGVPYDQCSALCTNSAQEPAFML